MSRTFVKNGEWTGGVAATSAGYTQGQGLLAALVRVPQAVLELALVWQERARLRRKLSELDDRLLRDIGLSRADIEPEVRKPFWRA